MAERALAADAEVERLERIVRFADLERHVLKACAEETPLERLLERIARTVELIIPGAFAGIRVIDGSCRDLLGFAAPNLSAELRQALMRTGRERPGSPCTQAIAEGRDVFCAHSAERCCSLELSDALRRARFETNWCQPLQSAAGRHIGTFVLLWPEVYEPTLEERDAGRRLRQLIELAVTRHQAARDREEALLVAQAANETKSRFLANMSHELRTPLNAVIGFAELLMNDGGAPLTEGQLDYVNDIHRAGRHLLALINDMLDLTQIELGKARMQPTAFPVDGLAEDCLRLCRPAALERQVTLFVDLADDLPPLVADERKLRQVVINLISNAIKFSHPGDTVVLTVRAVEPDKVRFTVSDTGTGIAPADLAKVFEPFHRGGDLYTSKTGGAGLGLAIVKALVALHGGTVTIASEVGVGTDVTVTLPSRCGGPQPA